MKEIFSAYSRYNQKTNAIIYSYIENMDGAQLGYNINAYYKNIGENIFHVLHSDIRWLGRLSRPKEFDITLDRLSPFKKNEAFDISLAAAKKAELAFLRSELDRAIIALIDSTPEDTFLKTIEIPFGKKTIVKPLWKLLFQWFNHHTHHRGQISIQLDLLGIENDFSLVLDKIED